MTALIGSIMARLQADASGLDSGLRIGASRVTQFEKRATDRLRAVDRAMMKTGTAAGVLGARLATLGKTSLVGLGTKGALAIGSVVSFTAAIAGAKAALDEFGDIADRSAAAGVDSEYFQGLAHSARLAGIDVGTLSGALNTLNKNVGLASEGKGKLVSQLQALNPQLLRAIQLATTQEQRIAAVADAIAREKDASRQAAIATAAFGGEGVKLVAILKDGGAAIDAMVTKAKDIGVVVDRDLVARADELGDRLDTASKIVQTKLNVGLVSLAPLMADAAGFAADFARKLAIAYELWRNTPTGDRQFLGSLQYDLDDTYSKIDTVKADIAALQDMLAGQGGEGTKVKVDIAEAQAKLAELTARAHELLARIQELQGYKPPVAAQTTGALDPRMMGAADLILGLYDPVEPAPAPSGKGSRNAEVDAAIRQAEAVRDLIAELTFERSLIGQSATEQRVATELRRAGVAATVEQRAQIASLVTTIETENDALDRLKDAYATAEGYAKSFASSLISDLSKGTSVAESLSNAFASLGEQLLQMAADQAITALFSNLVGAAIGGGLQPFGGSAMTPRTGLPPIFAEGGFTGVGGKYQPAGLVHKGEYVFDAASVRSIGVPNLERIRGYASGGYVGGPGGSSPLPINDNEPAITLAPVYHIDARGSSVTKAGIKAMLEANNRKLAADLPAMLADSRRRGAV